MPGWLASSPELQTLIEVCTDFASLSPSINIHRPAQQAFAVEEDEDSEEMFAMMDCSQWTRQGVSEPAITPSLSLRGWDMRCDRLLVGQTTFSAGTRLHQNQVFQLRSDGTYASSLPKAGFDATVQATGLEHAVR